MADSSEWEYHLSENDGSICLLYFWGIHFPKGQCEHVEPMQYIHCQYLLFPNGWKRNCSVTTKLCGISFDSFPKRFDPLQNFLYLFFSPMLFRKSSFNFVERIYQLVPSRPPHFKDNKEGAKKTGNESVRLLQVEKNSFPVWHLFSCRHPGDKKNACRFSNLTSTHLFSFQGGILPFEET